MLNGFVALLLDPTDTVSLPESCCGLAPSKLSPAPNPSWEGPKFSFGSCLHWWSSAEMLLHGSLSSWGVPALSHLLALAMQNAMQNYLKSATKMGMCTKHNLKHPCPPMVNGKDSEYILVFKFKPAPEKPYSQNLLGLGETWLSPWPGSWSTGWVGAVS